LLRAAMLFSPMVPFELEAPVDLAGTSVLIVAGRSDPIVPARQAERLAEMLRQAGADVALHWEAGGHELTAGGVNAAERWLAQHLARSDVSPESREAGEGARPRTEARS
jgi:predicted esterase